MSGYIGSPVYACYLERGRRGRVVHAHPMDLWFHEQTDPLDFYGYSFLLDSRLRRPEDQVAFGIPNLDGRLAFIDRRAKEVNGAPSTRPSPDGGELLQSLAKRLEALEELVAGPKKQSRSIPDPVSSLQQTSKNPVKKTPLPTENRPTLHFNPDDAATIIQSRFRAYLVRRSQTLGHLQEIGVIKSTLKEFDALFSDIAYRRVLCRDPDERRRFSERTISLLLKVDSIPGTNYMVREARRSVSKEIVGLLDSVDHLEWNQGPATRSANGRKVRSKRPLRNQVEQPVASQARMDNGIGDIEGVCLSGAEVPMAHFSCRKGTHEEEEEEILEGQNDRRGGLPDKGFRISSSSRRERKGAGIWESPTFTFRKRDRGNGRINLALPLHLHLRGEMEEVVAMSGGFVFHTPRFPFFFSI